MHTRAIDNVKDCVKKNNIHILQLYYMQNIDKYFQNCKLNWKSNSESEFFLILLIYSFSVVYFNALYGHTRVCHCRSVATFK